jgi:hypothetical protein
VLKRRGSSDRWRAGKTLCFYRHFWHGNQAYPY